jgi:uncharacterized Zn-finger protein
LRIIRAPQRSTRGHVQKRETMAQPIPEAPEVMEVPSRTVACDGNGGALGHPRVFLTMNDHGYVECPYCDRKFVLKGGAKAGAH